MTTAQFIALAERISGQDLGAFFDEWLFTPARPASLPAARPAAALAVRAPARDVGQVRERLKR